MLVTPIPNNLNLFFHGAAQVSVPFSCGFLCAQVNIARGHITVSHGNAGQYAFDNSSPKRSLTAFIGQNRNFQLWYRDPSNFANCGYTYNLSNALSIDILP